MSKEPPKANLVSSKFLHWAFVLALASHLATPIINPEVFGQLTVGRWILSHQTLPRAEFWTQLGEGRRYISESWLVDLTLASVEAYRSSNGLLTLKYILVLLTTISIIGACVRRSQNTFVGTLLGTLAAAGTLIALPLGSMLVGIIAFTWFLVAIYLFGEARGKIATLSFLGLAAICYSNLHSSFLGAAFVGLMVLPSLPSSNMPRVLSYLVICILALFLTPYLGENLLVLDKHLNALWIMFVFQLNPATVFYYPTAFLLLLLLICALFAHYRPIFIGRGELAVLGALVLLSLGHRLFTPFALVFTGILAANIWGRASGEGFGKFGEGLKELSKKGKHIYPGLTFVLLCVALVNTVQLFRSPISGEVFPDSIAAVLVERKEELLPVLHAPSIGSYLIYKFSGDDGLPFIRPALDKRAWQYDPDLAFKAERIERLEYGWEELFHVLEPRSVLCHVGTPLHQLLTNHSGWELAQGIEAATSAGQSLADLRYALFERKKTARLHPRLY